MKKIFTLFASLSIVCSLQAQSYQILDQDNGNADVSGTVLDYWTSPGVKVIKELSIKNNGSAAKQTRCKRVFVSGVVNPDDTIELCWNVCLSPTWNTTQTAGNVNIAAGATLNYSTGGGIGFHSTFKTTAANYGTKTVRYTFYDNANNGDSVSVTVNYHLTATGVNETNLKSFLLSGPMPNPASTSATIKYDFPVAAKTSIRLYNAMGAVIREFKIEDLNGKVTINTEDLAGGLYFYSLIVNDKATATKKLIVSH